MTKVVLVLSLVFALFSLVFERGEFVVKVVGILKIVLPVNW